MSGLETPLFIAAVAALIVLFFVSLIILAFIWIFGNFVMSLIRRFSFDCSITERSKEVRKERKAKERIMEFFQKQIDSLT